MQMPVGESDRMTHFKDVQRLTMSDLVMWLLDKADVCVSGETVFWIDYQSLQKRVIK